MTAQQKKPFHQRRLFQVILVLGLLLVGGLLWARWRPATRFDTGPPGPGELRVVTWNVGYFAPLKVKSAKETDTQAIVEVLRPLAAHLIVLQELGSLEQADEIAAALGEPWTAHGVATGLPGQYLAALSALPTGEPATHEAGGRKMLGLEVNGPGDERIFFLALHAPHPGRGRQETRDYIRAAAEWAGQQEDAAVTVFGGDLNHHFSADPNEAQDKALYREICDGFADSTAALGDTYYAHTRIDYVFHAPKDLPVVVAGSGLVDIPRRVAKAPGWRDHRPIVVTIKLP